MLTALSHKKWSLTDSLGNDDSVVSIHDSDSADRQGCQTASSVQTLELRVTQLDLRRHTDAVLLHMLLSLLCFVTYIYS